MTVHRRQSSLDLAPVLSRADTMAQRGSRAISLGLRYQRGTFANALLSTAVSRCWPILLFFAAWATLITVLNHKGHHIVMQSTLLTVVGTVLGFVISYRTTSSFERYNEGRRLWSQITLASRTFSRTVWFHVPHTPPSKDQSEEEANARSIIEKKTVINLLEAFSVAIKHYLRGEDGIYYHDLYYLVKFLPQYALPRAMADMSVQNSEAVQDGEPNEWPASSQTRRPTATEIRPLYPSETHQNTAISTSPRKQTWSATTRSVPLDHRNVSLSPRDSQTISQVPLPVSTPPSKRKSLLASMASPFSSRSTSMGNKWTILSRQDEKYLMPDQIPPRYSFFDIFPFSLLVTWLMEQGKDVKGRKGAFVRAKMHSQTTVHNLPLELSFYLSSYIASLQTRKVCDVPTTNTLLAALNQLVDSLTGLERILTSPIPFSYNVHIWSITIIFCLALPPQIWSTLKWLTIPGTIVISFIFFGFLVAGEEIENPFGYDKNDLNLDHFTHNIIRNELEAVTSVPPPDPTRWAFVSENDLLFTDQLDDRVSPEDWITKGSAAMQKSLSQL